MLQPGNQPHVGIEHLPLNPYAHCNFGHLAIAIVIFPVASIPDHQSPPTTSKTPPPYKKADTTKPLHQQKRATLPINQSVSANAQAAFVAEDYIGTSFSNGGGDLTSSTLPAAVLELFQRLQIAEKSASSNPNNITITYDTETELATINAEMPVSFTVSSNGSVSIVAVPYLA